MLRCGGLGNQEFAPLRLRVYPGAHAGATTARSQRNNITLLVLEKKVKGGSNLIPTRTIVIYELAGEEITIQGEVRNMSNAGNAGDLRAEIKFGSRTNFQDSCGLLV